MRNHFLLSAIVVISALALGACSKSGDPNAPLAFVPADTPYVMANIDPLPKDVFDQLMAQMQPVFSNYANSLDYALAEINRDLERILATTDHKDDGTFEKTLRAIIEEVKSQDSLEKWQQLGFKPDGRMAFYGIGLVPVLRMELSDTTGFRSAITRIEAKVGQKLAVDSIDNQEYWQLGTDKLQGILALQGNQLVISLMPQNASADLRRQLLGLVRPRKSLLDSNGLAAVNQKHHYISFFSGYLDIQRITALLAGEHSGIEREFAQAFDLPLHASEPVCIDELNAITARFPRITIGYTEFTAKRMTISTKLELDGTLAKELMGTVAPVPGLDGGGTNPADALLDISFAFPVLQLKDFWLKQTQAVIDKPYNCPNLTELNERFAQLHQQLNQTIPPPASNVLGARFVLNRLAFNPQAKPEIAGLVLVALDNPAVLVGMAQLVMPALKDIHIASDGRPVAIPAGPLTSGFGPMFVAMNERAIAISIGDGQDAGLKPFLGAPQAKDSTLLHIAFDGILYESFGQALDQFKSMLASGATPQEVERQKQMIEIYQKILKHCDIRVTVLPDAIELIETVEMH